MHFWKMEATGNDFIMVQEMEGMNYSKLAIDMCNRHYGCGGDGLLVFGNNPLSMTVYNADGTNAKMCGNGLRCIAFLASLLGNKENILEISTQSGIKKVQKLGGIYYTTLGKGLIESIEEKKIGETNVTFYLVDFGVKHAILVNQMLEEDDIRQLQKELDCNIDFIEYHAPYRFTIQTYERGVGWTLGCGSGVGAGYVVGREYFMMDEYVLAYQKGGEVLVGEENGEIVLCGGVSLVYEGEYIWSE